MIRQLAIYHIRGVVEVMWGCGVYTHYAHTHVTRKRFPRHCQLSQLSLTTPMSPGPSSGQLTPGPGESPATAWAKLTPCLLAPVATGHRGLQSLHNPVTTDSRSPLPSVSACGRVRTGLTANSWPRLLPGVSRPTAGHATALVVTCLSWEEGTWPGRGHKITSTMTRRDCNIVTRTDSLCHLCH